MSQDLDGIPSKCCREYKSIIESAYITGSILPGMLMRGNSD